MKTLDGQEEISNTTRFASGNYHALKRALLTLVLPAYNESAIIDLNLERIITYLKSLESSYDWEILIINDGSKDNTGALAEKWAQLDSRIRVYHHPVNKGLGKALQTAFKHSRGDFVVTMDIDLSISIDHIERLLSKIKETNAKIVIASPTVKGGKISNVPVYRKILSIVANKFLSFICPAKINNFTCMVRVYDGEFIRTLNLRGTGMEIMQEIIFKAMIMRAGIVEIPAHLKWDLRDAKNVKIMRVSSMKLFKHIMATLISGFLLRPFFFFILPGFLLFAFSLYPLTWMMIHIHAAYHTALEGTFIDNASMALEVAYRLHPHTFLIGLLSLLLSIQLIALGFQSLQSRYYFEEMYHFMTKLYRGQIDNPHHEE